MLLLRGKGFLDDGSIPINGKKLVKKGDFGCRSCAGRRDFVFCGRRRMMPDWETGSFAF